MTALLAGYGTNRIASIDTVPRAVGELWKNTIISIGVALVMPMALRSTVTFCQEFGGTATTADRTVDPLTKSAFRSSTPSVPPWIQNSSLEPVAALNGVVRWI